MKETSCYISFVQMRVRMQEQNIRVQISRTSSAIGWRMLTVDVTNEFIWLRYNPCYSYTILKS